MHNLISSCVICLCTVVPTTDIITSDGGVFIAGLSYNLTCTVTLENTTGTPTVGWLDPNNNPLHSSSGITVGDTVAVNCSTYTTTLQFTTLHTSHGGQYSCRVTLGPINNTAAVNITVLRKSKESSHVIMVVVSLPCLFYYFLFLLQLIGASLSESHTSELSGGFLIGASVSEPPSSDANGTFDILCVVRRAAYPKLIQFNARNDTYSAA